MAIKELRKTNEISNIDHEKQEPIFITKNGYSDLVIMSSELFDKKIFESEEEVKYGAKAVEAEVVFSELEKKHFG